MGVGSRAKKRRVPLKETSDAEIDDLRSTNEMPSPEAIDINDELIDDIDASQDEGINLERVRKVRYSSDFVNSCSIFLTPKRYFSSIPQSFYNDSS